MANTVIKGEIISVCLFSVTGTSATIKCPDGSQVEISIPSEATKGWSIRERLAKIMQRAESYLETVCKCQEAEEGLSKLDC